MNPLLVFDFETQHLPVFDQPSDHPDQPHIVQVGAALVDLDTKRELATLDLIVRPDGWTIPDEVAAIHGITTEMAMDLGVPESVAVDALLSLWRPTAPRRKVGHNSSFDDRIMRIGLKRFIDRPDMVMSDHWKAHPSECTARLADPIMKLPPTAKMRAARRFHHKTPNLGEAYLHFTGQQLEGAHNAMVDVRACLAVYLAITERQQAGEAVAA